MASDVVIASLLESLLRKFGRNGFWYEVGKSGNIRLTMSVELPPDVAGDIVETVRQHSVRR
jgi:hypothetical protein